MKKYGKEVDKPLGRPLSFEEVKELAESMGAKIVEEPEKHGIPGSTNIYSLAWKRLVRFPAEEQEEENEFTKSYILLHELGHIRMEHGRGRGTAVGAVLEELEADRWAFTTKAGIPPGDYIVGMLAAKTEDVGMFEFGLSKREAWKATRKAAEKFGIHKSLIRKAEKEYWRQVG